LEKALKEVYLNKWYYSGLRHLKGMSPSEASQTEEGKQLLWSMLKKFRQKEKNISRQRLSLQEYVRKLEQKKHEKQS
jgi:aspartate oxidase